MRTRFPIFPMVKSAVSRIESRVVAWRPAKATSIALTAAVLVSGAIAGTAAAAPHGSRAAVEVIPADSAKIKQALIEARSQPGTRGVLVNVWATWCEPCREEMPDLARILRDPRARGVRLLLISADSQANSAAVASTLAKLKIPGPSYLKTGDDMDFINGLDPAWDGTMPTSWLYDAEGNRTHVWNGKISYPELLRQIAALGKPAKSKKSIDPTLRRKS
jgi:thiol-disulfide isomerase/thioredoxin